MAPSDFINLVEENDSRALYSSDRFAGNFLFVEEPLGGFAFKMVKGIWNAHAPPGTAATEQARHHAAEVDVHLLSALPCEDLEAWQLGFSYFNFDRAIIKGPVSKLSPKLFTSCALLGAACKISVLIDGWDRLRLWGWREQQVKQSFFLHGF